MDWHEDAKRIPLWEGSLHARLAEAEAVARAMITDARDARARVAHLDDAETLERLAELEHEQWSHWTRHILDVMAPALDLMQDRYDNGYSDDAEDRCLESVDRWNRQIATPYGELSDGEMESDRVWARRVLATLEAP